MEKRIVIIGAGITGLATALALKQQVPDILIEIHEQEQKYSDHSHVILWKAAVNILLDLGLGHRMSRIATPLTKIRTNTLKNGVWEAEKQFECNERSMLSVRRCDLIRMLLTALIDPSFANSNIYSHHEPNNATVSGIEADLAVPNWFEDEGYEQLLPFIKFGSKLSSVRFLASNGAITCLFEDGTKVGAYMLLGCDGSQSIIRGYLTNDRVKLQHTQQCLIQGVTDLLNLQQESTDPLLPVMSREEFLQLYPNQQANTYSFDNNQVSVINIGNDLLQWTVLLPQNECGELANEFCMPRRRQLLAQGKDAQMTPVNAYVPPTINDEFTLPRHNASKLPAIAFAQLGSSNLDGIESRDLCLTLLSQHKVPRAIMSLVASTDIYQTSTIDNTDHYGEEYLKSFTSSGYHPGRMFCMGEAAFTLCSGVLGNHGITLALNDAVTMAKLYALHHSDTNNSNSGSPQIILEGIARAFDSNRLDQKYECLKNARLEAKYIWKEPGYLSYFTGTGQESWMMGKFEDYLDRGGLI